MSESWHVYEGVMGRMWMSHGTHVDDDGRWRLRYERLCL